MGIYSDTRGSQWRFFKADKWYQICLLGWWPRQSENEERAEAGRPDGGWHSNPGPREQGPELVVDGINGETDLRDSSKVESLASRDWTDWKNVQESPTEDGAVHGPGQAGAGARWVRGVCRTLRCRRCWGWARKGRRTDLPDRLAVVGEVAWRPQITQEGDTGREEGQDRSLRNTCWR